jgi:hypothetical protein
MLAKRFIKKVKKNIKKLKCSPKSLKNNKLLVKVAILLLMHPNLPFHLIEKRKRNVNKMFR